MSGRARYLHSAAAAAPARAQPRCWQRPPAPPAPSARQDGLLQGRGCSAQEQGAAGAGHLLSEQHQQGQQLVLVGAGVPLVNALRNSGQCFNYSCTSAHGVACPSLSCSPWAGCWLGGRWVWGVRCRVLDIGHCRGGCWL